MAEMKIDITPIVDKVLDGTEYAGFTLREWIAKIKNASIGERRSKPAFWRFDGEMCICPSCRKKYWVSQMYDEIWRFCPKCGIRIEPPYRSIEDVIKT
jgi:uncharacterized protein with PIN domain